MIKEIMYKWFGIEPIPCGMCEILRLQLEQSNRERRELLTRLLDKGESEPPIFGKDEEFKPVTSRFTPWNVRRQILEAESRKKAEILRKHQEEVSKLEQELEISNEFGKEEKKA